MKISIGCDHAGYEYKEKLKTWLTDNNYEVIDEGCFSEEAVDYPVYAKKVCNCVLSKEADFGILLCGTGIGMSIAANKIKGIRAACCGDIKSAELTRQHNDANVLAMGARVIGPGLALKIVDIFLDTPFSNDERHVRRIGMIE